MSKRSTRTTSTTSQKTASEQTAQTEQETKETEMTSQTTTGTIHQMSHTDAVIAARAMAQAWSAGTGRPEPTEKTPKTPKSAETRKCLCGCGRDTKSAFAPGHDAKSKSAMRAIANGQMVRVSLGEHTGEEWKPSAELQTWAQEHGWADDMTPLARDKHHAKAQPVKTIAASTNPDMI